MHMGTILLKTLKPVDRINKKSGDSINLRFLFVYEYYESAARRITVPAGNIKLDLKENFIIA